MEKPKSSYRILILDKSFEYPIDSIKELLRKQRKGIVLSEKDKKRIKEYSQGRRKFNSKKRNYATNNRRCA